MTLSPFCVLRPLRAVFHVSTPLLVESRNFAHTQSLRRESAVPAVFPSHVVVRPAGAGHAFEVPHTLHDSTAVGIVGG